MRTYSFRSRTWLVITPSANGRRSEDIVRLPRLVQFRIDRQGFVRSPMADIAQQGETEEFFRGCRVRWKPSVERRHFGIVTGLEEGRSLEFRRGRSTCQCWNERCGDEQDHERTDHRDQASSVLTNTLSTTKPCMHGDQGLFQQIPQAVQKGHPARPQQRRGDAYAGRYVEPLSVARTPLADFINSLMVGLKARSRIG